MKMNTTTKTIVADFASTIEYSKRRAAAVRKHQAKLTKTIEFLNGILAKFPEDGPIHPNLWVDVNAYGWSGEPPVTVVFNPTVDVTSMKTGILVELLAALTSREFEVTDSKDHASEYSAQRSFHFKRAQSDAYLPIRCEVTAVLKDAPDATCHKVQTGTKVVEVPEYKLICEE